MTDLATSSTATRQRDWAGIALNVGLLICFAIFLLELPFFARAGNQEFINNLWYHGYVLIWLLVLTALGRTLPLRVLAAAFFFGMFPAMAVALLVGFPVGAQVGTDTAVFDSVLVPLLEEAVKLLPIIFFFWWLTRRGRWQPSMTDGLLLGFLVGAGFAIHEDALYSRVYAEGFDQEFGLVLPIVGEGVTIFRQTVLGVYHSGWTALTGLSVGAWFMLRHRSRWAVLIPIVAILVVLIDHGIGNYIIAMRDLGALDVLWKLDMEGRLPVYLLLAGVVAAVLFEIYVLRLMSRRDYLFKGVAPFALVDALRSGGVAGLRKGQAVRIYVRARRAVHYWIWAAKPSASTADRVREMGLSLARLSDEAGLIAPDTIPEEPAAAAT